MDEFWDPKLVLSALFGSGRHYLTRGELASIFRELEDEVRRLYSAKKAKWIFIEATRDDVYRALGELDYLAECRVGQDSSVIFRHEAARPECFTLAYAKKHYCWMLGEGDNPFRAYEEFFWQLIEAHSTDTMFEIKTIVEARIEQVNKMIAKRCPRCEHGDEVRVVTMINPRYCHSKWNGSEYSWEGDPEMCRAQPEQHRLFELKQRLGEFSL